MFSPDPAAGHKVILITSLVLDRQRRNLGKRPPPVLKLAIYVLTAQNLF
jgi:hypothetical protein